jgi:hypothetical protein
MGTMWEEERDQWEKVWGTREGNGDRVNMIKIHYM